jgi:hypothetical protein
MPPLHRVRARPSAVGERYVENAFTGRSVLPDPESQIVRDLTRRVEALEKDVAALKARPAGQPSAPQVEGIVDLVRRMIDDSETRMRAAAPAATMTVNAPGPLSPETLAALEQMAAAAVEKLRADAPPTAAGTPPAVQELARVVQDAHVLLEGQIAQLKAVLQTMNDHGPRLGHIEQALGVLHAAAAAVAQRS